MIPQEDFREHELLAKFPKATPPRRQVPVRKMWVGFFTLLEVVTCSLGFGIVGLYFLAAFVTLCAVGLWWVALLAALWCVGDLIQNTEKNRKKNSK